MGLSAVEILEDFPEVLTLIKKGSDALAAENAKVPRPSQVDIDLNVAVAVLPDAVALFEKIEAQSKD